MQNQETETILLLARQGDAAAWTQLVTQYQGRLRRMIEVFLDTRLSARVDPSDVLQEVFVCAANRLPSFLENRSVEFYPWLRGLVRDELIRLQRHHLYAKRRTVQKERPFDLEISDESVQLLADRLVGDQTSPSRKVEQNERRAQVQVALNRLQPADREILLMRCLEQLSVREIAEVQGITEPAAKSRLRRAFQKIGNYLSD